MSIYPTLQPMPFGLSPQWPFAVSNNPITQQQYGQPVQQILQILQTVSQQLQQLQYSQQQQLQHMCNSSCRSSPRSWRNFSS